MSSVRARKASATNKDIFRHVVVQASVPQQIIPIINLKRRSKKELIDVTRTSSFTPIASYVAIAPEEKNPPPATNDQRTHSTFALANAEEEERKKRKKVNDFQSVFIIAKWCCNKICVCYRITINIGRRWQREKKVSNLSSASIFGRVGCA